MAIVLDSNQVPILCDQLSKKPQLSSLDVILPPHVLAELILWGNQECLNKLYTLRPRIGLDHVHVMSALASCNEDEIRTFRPFPSSTTGYLELYEQLVNALTGPSQRHHQWATDLKATNKDFCGQVKKSALDFRKHILDEISTGKIQKAYKVTSIEDAMDAFGKGPHSFIGSVVSATISEGGKRQIVINDRNNLYDAVMANPFFSGLFKIILFYYMSYSRMWDHNHQKLNFDPTVDRDDWTDITVPLYATTGDTILTQDKKLCNAITSVYGTGNLIIKKASDL